jgi:hypothetical protein
MLNAGLEGIELGRPVELARVSDGGGRIVPRGQLSSGFAEYFVSVV